MAQVRNSNLFENIEDIRQQKDVLVVLVRTDWNAAIVDELERGAIAILREYGIAFKILSVPGAVEIPFAVQQCFNMQRATSAFIALGCVIRGDTPHFDYVCQTVTNGILQLNLNISVPVIHGVLTVNNEEQAKERIGGAYGHKGEEAAVAAIKMILLNRKLLGGKF